MSLIRQGGIHQAPAKTAFGELSVSQETPVVQISAEYGLLGVLTATLGGTDTVVDNMFTVSTGTGPNNVSAIISERESNQRPGQGLTNKFSALFTAGQPDSLQEAGLISSESAFAFGYNGDSFGILYGSEGELETQSLQITTGGGNESATITVDGVAHSVPITASSINENAYEIAQELNILELRYRFSSNGDSVIALARLPDFGGGSFAFSSATAVAVWTEIAAGVIPIEVWTPIESWNREPNFNIDPTKLNDYKIQIQGNINFYIKEQATGEFTLVHIFEHINTATKPSIGNPTFRTGWAARNSGNTTNLVVQGGYAATFVEGMIKYNQIATGQSSIQESVGLVATNVISLRNRAVFKGSANRAEIIPLMLSLGTDAGKPAIFEVIVSPQTTGFLEWQYVDEESSLMEYSISDAPITGQDVAVFTVSGSLPPIDMQKIIEFTSPTSEFSIAARTTGGAAAEMVVSATWKDDL